MPKHANDVRHPAETGETGAVSGGITEQTGAVHDVRSDPALDDRLGSDWTDEGGATSEGPATATEDH